jgi:hypothetical protein
MGADSGGACGGAALNARSLAVMRYLRRAHLTVIPRARVSSTPRPLDSITDVSDCWIARFRGR